MANVTPAIIDYGKRMLDAGFADKSFIEQWFVNTEKYIKLDFQEAGAIRIMQIALDGLSDYYRVNHAGIVNNVYANNNAQNLAGARDGLARGNVQANWVTYYCKHLRGKQLPIDYIDDMEMAGRLIAVTLDEFIRTSMSPNLIPLASRPSLVAPMPPMATKSRLTIRPIRTPSSLDLTMASLG